MLELQYYVILPAITNLFSYVQGMHNEFDTEGKIMGKYEYDQDGNPLQFFAVQVSMSIYMD